MVVLDDVVKQMRSLPSLGRRTVLKTLGVGLTAPLLFGRTARVAGAAGDSWTIAVIPDTQKYVDSKKNVDLSGYADDQTKWIVDNLADENIAFVTHVGDLVENAGVTDEWRRIDEILSRLDGVVPYSVLPGNHDWVFSPDWNDPRTIEEYREWFGPSRFDGYSWYGESGPDGLSHCQFFSAGGYEFLHLALEWEVPGTIDDPETPFGWANQILQQYSDYPTIVTTHSYLVPNRGRKGAAQGNWGETSIDGEPDPHRQQGNSGQDIWTELIKPNEQVFLVFNGHFVRGDDCEDATVSQNDAGLDVYQLMADYQDRPNGGDGWMQLLSFEPGGSADGKTDRLQVQTYSPSLDEWEEDSDSKYHFDFTFADRFSVGATQPDPVGGDVDGDGDVDDDDLTKTQQHIAGKEVEGEFDAEAADMDGDDDIDISDAVAIRNEIDGGPS